MLYIKRMPEFKPLPVFINEYPVMMTYSESKANDGWTKANMKGGRVKNYGVFDGEKISPPPNDGWAGCQPPLYYQKHKAKGY